VATLYLTEQRSIIRKTSDRLIVEKDDTVLLEVPCLKLDTVLIYGNVQVTTQALFEMLDHGIELAFFSLSGKLRGQLTPPKAKNVFLRMRQYEAVKSETVCLPIARAIVAAKISNSMALLRRYRKSNPEGVPLETLQTLSRFSEEAERSLSLERLRGMEGTAAARYFQTLGNLLPPGFTFDGRNRRPPRDPLNALLSFGYVLAGNEIQSLLDGMGFDPYLGVYHQMDYGRPSLALDLVEEFRAALVDRFSLSLLKLGVLKPDDFRSDPERGVLLRRESMKTYFTAYEKELTTPFSGDGQELTYRGLFRRQAERLAKALTEGEPYQPFRLPC
jgi:CRISPR-associated protein Cas1